MNGLENILPSLDIALNFENQFSGLSAITKMMQSQQVWQNQIIGLGMQQARLKSIGQHQAFYLKNFSGLDTITKSIAMQPKFNIPSAAFDTISSIGRQHEQLFGNLKGIAAAAAMNQSAFSQMKNLQFALSGISGQMAAIAAAQKNWSLLDEFVNIGEQAIEISNNLTSEIALTEAESKRFESLIEFILTLLKKNKKFGTNALLFLSVIVNLMALHQYYDFIKDKPETATNEDLAKFEKKIIQTITTKLIEQKEYRITNRSIRVMLKPKFKSKIIEVLPIHFEIVVLKVHHKWIYASYFSPKENLPQTGWILKKYLDKPE